MHRVGHEHHLIVVGGGIRVGIQLEARLVLGLEGRAVGHLVEHGAALGADHGVVHRVAAELAHLGAAQGVAAQQLGSQAELLHLPRHGRGLGRVAAKEDSLRLLGLEAGEDGEEIGGLVGGELLAHHREALLLRLLGELVGHALAEGGAVVDHGHLFDLEHLSGIHGHVGADLRVAGNDAEQVLVAAFRHLGVGAHGGHHGAAVVIDPRRGDGHARAVRAHDELHAAVHQLLRHAHAGARITLVVFRHEFEFQRLALDHDLFRVEFLDGQAHAVLVVLARKGVGARERAAVADLDDLLLRAGLVGVARQQQGRDGRGRERPKSERCTCHGKPLVCA